MNERNLILCVCLIISCLSVPICVHAGEDEVITITTYYPSPYGSYNKLEVRGKMALGNIATDPKIGDLNNLKDGQLYIGNSLVLKSLNADPGPATSPKAGQLIYNDQQKMLKFHNGNSWINTACLSGQSCKPNNYVPPNTCSNPSYTCQPPAAAGTKYVTTVTGFATCCVSTQLCMPGCPPPDPTSCPAGSTTAWTSYYNTGQNPPAVFYNFVRVCVK